MPRILICGLEDGFEARLDWLPYTLDIPSYLGSARVDERGEVIEAARNAHQWRRVRYSYMDSVWANRASDACCASGDRRMMALIKKILRTYVPLRTKELLVRYALANGPELAFERVKSKGFLPGGVIDVGAYHGEWSWIASRVFPGVPVLMIEAQEEKRDQLMQKARRLGGDNKVEIAVLGDVSGKEVTFYVMETGSSIYAENTEVPRSARRLKMRTLDEIVAKSPMLKEPFLLKLDVQGAELDVLRGATNTVRRTEFVMLEVPIIAYNAGAPNLLAVLSFMDSVGFVPFDVCSLIRIAGNDLCQMDMIFVRKTSASRRTLAPGVQ